MLLSICWAVGVGVGEPSQEQEKDTSLLPSPIRVSPEAAACVPSCRWGKALPHSVGMEWVEKVRSWPGAATAVLVALASLLLSASVSQVGKMGE